MVRYAIGTLTLSLMLSAISFTWAAGPDPAAALAEKIDQFLAARWNAEQVQPAPLADDAEFLRRASLDLIGRIPSVAEARAFLADPAPDKRRRLVKQLLSSPAHADHFTNAWRDLLLPEAGTNGEVQGQLGQFNAWLRKQIADNVGYDRMVRELLTVPFGGERVRTRMPTRAVPAGEAAPTPVAFYLAKEVKPENLAASTARLFLGVKLECAQCHDHPTDRWTRQQFWGLAAFFAGLRRETPEGGGGVRELFDVREMTIPGSTQVADAGFLDNSAPRWRFNVGARTTLADWLTAPGNRFFARAAVNRLWAHCFGIGLVEPVDDARMDNPPSHPELLDELARQFAAQRYDMRFLIRALTASQAYQRTSAAAPSAGLSAARDDTRLFVRMAVKGLTPEQLFDSLALATGYRAPAQPRGANGDRPAVDAARAEFLAKFANAGQPRTEVETSIQQALTLMNGRFLAEAAGLKGGGTLAAVTRNPALDTAGRIEELFLATLTRKPTPQESARLVAYVDRSDRGPGRTLADVFWALLNSTEFYLNH
jgi:hypothetical protein